MILFVIGIWKIIHFGVEILQNQMIFISHWMATFFPVLLQLGFLKMQEGQNQKFMEEKNKVECSMICQSTWQNISLFYAISHN